MLNESSFVPFFLSLSIFFLTLFIKCRERLYGYILAFILGLASLLRGEFLFLGGASVMMLSGMLDFKQKPQRLFFLTFLSIITVFPLLWAMRNFAVYGIFVPGRTQNWQHLYQNIGEYPNPWGIQATDTWMLNYLSHNGYRYGSLEADQFLRKKYLSALVERPDIIIHNFSYRLADISRDFFPLPDRFIIMVVGLVVLLRKKTNTLLLMSPVLIFFAIYYMLMSMIIYGRLIKYVFPLSYLALTIETLFIYYLLTSVFRMFQKLFSHARHVSI